MWTDFRIHVVGPKAQLEQIEELVRSCHDGEADDGTWIMNLERYVEVDPQLRLHYYWARDESCCIWRNDELHIIGEKPRCAPPLLFMNSLQKLFPDCRFDSYSTTGYDTYEH